MTKESLRELFLNLTEYTIPFGKESTLEKYLPEGIKKDEVGNYYIEIGNSETMFSTHLDTYSKNYEKVNHVFDENDPYIIKTDGKTILGGDNKLGTSIMLSMIKHNVPGTYYFFLGEEPILSGGVWGSKNIAQKNPDFFKKFKRCIAFDRRKYGSIVVRQMGRMCCSSEFAKAVANNFDINGIKWDQEGGFGYYTDTAVFMDLIPECTNISAGGFNEHYKTEWVDLNYTWKVYQAAINTDWENLPTQRELENRFLHEDDTTKVTKYDRFKEDKNVESIKDIFDYLGISLTRDTRIKGTRRLTFSKWLEDYDFDIMFRGNEIIYNDEVYKFDEILEIILSEFKNDIIAEIQELHELYKNGDAKDKKKASETLSYIIDIFEEKDLNSLIKKLK
jgi:hypothetical protein